ncbi:transcription-repair coupling factor [Camelimonas abortus]|uniref:transcription-repair coupling factor n=1 Tax=Camelimonas abortus TaxID=1017184 RepID=UPI0035E58359
MSPLPLQNAAAWLLEGRKPVLASAPDSFIPLLLADLARAVSQKREAPAALVYVARDGRRLQLAESGLAFVAPDIEVLTFPSWDCQPYDRVSPSSAVTARRMTVLARLARTRSTRERPRIVLTTVNALTQRVPPRARIAGETFSAAPGNAVDMSLLVKWLEINGFTRTGTVRDTGEYAQRGGILDLYAPGAAAPVRLDFFGDTLESIRAFDPETQRTTGQLRSLDLVPMSEAQLTTETIARFRQAYVAAFGAATRDDALYETVSEGRRHPGMEHWLPLFHRGMDTLFDYLAGAPFVLDEQLEDAAFERISQIEDYYEARLAALKAGTGAPYKPVRPETLYLTREEWRRRIGELDYAEVSAFARPETPSARVIDLGVRQARSFAPERADEGVNVFEAAAAHLRDLAAGGRRVVVAAWSEGSRERLAHVLADHGLRGLANVPDLARALAVKGGDIAMAVWGMEAGFDAPHLSVLAEQDILGDRLVRQARKARRAQDFIAEVGSLTAGDIVVHVDHGVGRFVGLKTITAGGAPHDCLELHYAGGDRLFLPVENIELLSRYGSEDASVVLDRLGGGAWQARKAKLKQRIRVMAGELIKVAAARALKSAPVITPPQGLYDEFVARFPYEETEDQLNAIEAVMADLASGRPMDRLICGDVGFGKTEVAMRAAFAVAMSGQQVAVVAPTTLLARQHYHSFSERFRGLPLKVAQLSRFTPAAEARQVKAGLADGTVDIVVGTHAVLGKTIRFRDLGLVVVDEEQHFGVAHKERLKTLRAQVHVLTLSATPIPRTLQLALTGVRELSIIATPPVDRLAVRTFVMPFDELSIREALLRERYRGGQAFYVVPRIEDLDEVKAFLDRSVPEVKVAVAHGQMSAGQLEDVMTAFYEGRFDVLLSTTIVESGLDIPNANTLVVHRADMFGLAQLYQLRGRVGRSRTRAWALFTVPANRTLTATAERRLKVLQGLDTLGAGFQLASHDLDIRGAGNLLGDEQSGHIREVGYELYQQMLEEAVAQLKAGVTDGEEGEEAWSPSITLGAAVMIPESYVEDIQLRLGLYKRLSTLENDQQIDAFGAELTDRFGPMPEEVQQLLKLMSIKALCLRANVAKIEAGPKGLVVAFRDGRFANPAGLAAWLAEQGSMAKVRPDMSIFFHDDLPTPESRLKSARALMRELVKVAGKKAA